MQTTSFQNIVLAVLLTFVIGWALLIGRSILLPVISAFLIVYLMDAACDGLGRLPLFRHLPTALLRVSVLLGFSLGIVFLSFLIAATVREISAVAPVYEANLDQLLEGLARQLDLEKQEIWNELRALTIEQLDISQILLSLLGGFTNVGALVFMIVVYATFMLAERGSLAVKIRYMSKDTARAEVILSLLGDINRKIRDYLTVKTLINLALGLVSWVILWAMGVDFAPFWAVTIGLLNYIPYVGSYIAVAFPVVLSVAQFGSLLTSLVLAVLLIAVQTVMGYIVEPRLIGRQMNLSPLVVLMSLSIWTALWGVPGAILSVPMTAVLAIILAGFDQTRFLAVLLAERIEVPAEAGRSE